MEPRSLLCGSLCGMPPPVRIPATMLDLWIVSRDFRPIGLGGHYPRMRDFMNRHLNWRSWPRWPVGCMSTTPKGRHDFIRC